MSRTATISGVMGAAALLFGLEASAADKCDSTLAHPPALPDTSASRQSDESAAQPSKLTFVDPFFKVDPELQGYLRLGSCTGPDMLQNVRMFSLSYLGAKIGEDGLTYGKISVDVELDKFEAVLSALSARDIKPTLIKERAGLMLFNRFAYERLFLIANIDGVTAIRPVVPEPRTP